MDPFQVVPLAAEALDRCRRRVQQDTCWHRGHAGDSLYASRRTLHTGVDLATTEQKTRLTALFATAEQLPVEVTWNIYQDMIVAYRDPDRSAGRTKMTTLIDKLSPGVPTALAELVTLGRTPQATGRGGRGVLRTARHQQRPDRGILSVSSTAGLGLAG